MFVETMSEIAAMDRPAGYHRVLLNLLARLDPVQFRKYSGPEICRETGLAIATVNRALLMLLADRVILDDGGKTAARALRLNNRLCWASTAEKWNESEADPEIWDGRGR